MRAVPCRGNETSTRRSFWNSSPSRPPKECFEAFQIARFRAFEAFQFARFREFDAFQFDAFSLVRRASAHRQFSRFLHGAQREARVNASHIGQPREMLTVQAFEIGGVGEHHPQ